MSGEGRGREVSVYIFWRKKGESEILETIGEEKKRRQKSKTQKERRNQNRSMLYFETKAFRMFDDWLTIYIFIGYLSA